MNVYYKSYTPIIKIVFSIKIIKNLIELLEVLLAVDHEYNNVGIHIHVTRTFNFVKNDLFLIWHCLNTKCLLQVLSERAGTLFYVCVIILMQ